MARSLVAGEALPSNDGSKRTVSESPETVRNEKWRNGDDVKGITRSPGLCLLGTQEIQ